MLKEFKAFALRGNAIDMAVGIIIGVAFSGIVNSLVADILMPPMGLLVGYDFSNLFITLKSGTVVGPYPTLAEAKMAAAVTLNYGMFINTVVNFLIVAFSMFLLIKGVKSLWVEAPPPPPPATKECSYCFSVVPLKATRCPNCTSGIG
ncbi:MAG: large conductance mechanosensitive channel protein MscL [Candidatus Methylomirabilis sp.]|nr:large conductance mechanosensitive channel protein MscL [Deltaproteobacteria bacterium]